MKKGNKILGWIIALIVAGCGLWLCSDWRLQGDDEARLIANAHHASAEMLKAIHRRV